MQKFTYSDTFLFIISKCKLNVILRTGLHNNPTGLHEMWDHHLWIPANLTTISLPQLHKTSISAPSMYADFIVGSPVIGRRVFHFLEVNCNRSTSKSNGRCFFKLYKNCINTADIYFICASSLALSIYILYYSTSDHGVYNSLPYSHWCVYKSGNILIMP